MGNIRHVLAVPHKKDCGALGEVHDGRWETPWSFAHGWLDRNPGELRKEYMGKSPDRHLYLVLRCNDRDCEGRCYVLGEDILKHIKPVPTRNWFPRIQLFEMLLVCDVCHEPIPDHETAVVSYDYGEDQVRFRYECGGESVDGMVPGPYSDENPMDPREEGE